MKSQIIIRKATLGYCLCAILVMASFAEAEVLKRVLAKPRPPRKYHESIEANMMSAAMLSSAAALSPKRPSAAALAATALASAASSSLAASSPASSPTSALAAAIPTAAAAVGAAAQQLFAPASSAATFLQSAASSASSAASALSAAAIPTNNMNGLSTRQRLMRAIAKEAFAYMAAPMFMPIAVTRAIFQPDGLPEDQAVLRRFARFLGKRVRPNRANGNSFYQNDNFLELITKNRKNILSTMKLFQDLNKKTGSSSTKKRF